MKPHTFLLLVAHDPRYMWDLDGLGKISRTSLGIGKKNLVILCDLPQQEKPSYLILLYLTCAQLSILISPNTAFVSLIFTLATLFLIRLI